jgi:hypothetical protein
VFQFVSSCLKCFVPYGEQTWLMKPIGTHATILSDIWRFGILTAAGFKTAVF